MRAHLDNAPHRASPMRRVPPLAAALLAAASALLGGCAGVSEGSRTFLAAPVAGGGQYAVRVSSIAGRRFATTLRQQRDYSCGAAAIATLLTFHYGMPTSEEEVLRDMLARGDVARIEREGFSLLDMRDYLARRSLASGGYRVPLDRLGELRVPAIALINRAGYRHFVVVRGLARDRVLLADPTSGTRTMRRSEFEAIWNGVLFFVTERVELARATFSRSDDWGVQPSSPLRAGLEQLEAVRVGLGMREANMF